MNAVIYYRDRRDRRGLAYQTDIATSWCDRQNWKIVGQVIETEGRSTRPTTRPELTRALRLCQIQKAVLFVPRFDQLSRSAATIGTILAHKVQVCTPDVASLHDPAGSATAMTVMASVAEFESVETQSRAKQTYAQIAENIRVNGHHVTRKGKTITRLGNVRSTTLATAEAVKARKAAKAAFAVEIEPVMRDLANRGCRSAGDFAKSLTAKGVVSPRGRTIWSPSMAANLMANLNIKPSAKITNLKPAPIYANSTLIEEPMRDAANIDAALRAQIIQAIKDHPELGIERLARQFRISYGVAGEFLNAAKDD